MCDCNQQRATFSSNQNQSRRGEVKVKLIQDCPMVLNGSITGRSYEFKKIYDTNWVDRRDVVFMYEIIELQVFN